MSAKSILSACAAALMALCLGAAAVVCADTTGANPGRYPLPSLLYTPRQAGDFSIQASVTLTTPTAIRTPTLEPTFTYTPISTDTPTATPSPRATATSCPLNFSDVTPGDYFYQAVRYLYCGGAVSGYADGTFRPYNDTTRGQTVKIVIIAFNFPINTTGGPHFTDVSEGSAFYPWVETAYNRGIVFGYSDGTFRPHNKVTRGQMAAIICRALEWPLIDPPEPVFTDVPRGSGFYRYVSTLYLCGGIIQGYGDGTFRPGNNVTRGQVSVIVFRAIKGVYMCGTPTPTRVPTMGKQEAPQEEFDFSIEASAPITTTTPTATDTPSATATPCNMNFSDVRPTDYFYEAVRYLYCRGAISGYADGTFRPGNNITRAQTTKMLVMAFDIPFYVPKKPTFKDVPPDHPFYVYIELYWHYAVGYCWTECFYFRPYNNMTRGQLCKIMVQLACWPLVDPAVPHFSDVPANHTFYQYIETAYDRGLIRGYSDGTFRPGNNVTRGQASKIVYLSVLQGSVCPTRTPTSVPTLGVK